jgi:hypothetical protein
MVTDRCVTRYTDSLFTIEAGEEEIGDLSVWDRCDTLSRNYSAGLRVCLRNLIDDRIGE